MDARTEEAEQDPAGEGGEEAEPRTPISRRKFVGRGSLGVAAAGVLASLPGLPSWLASSAPEASGAAGDANVVAGDASGAEQSIVAQVHNINTGDISLHINGTTVAVRDPQLARNIARAMP
ncbi:MAG: twin-arginine translocation signal domain-containing protein [Acidimicrobiales bacterium]